MRRAKPPISSPSPALLLLAIVMSISPLGAMRSAAAEDTSALINQELDKLVKLQVDGVLPQVIKAIADKTGVPIEPDRSVYALLPWGDQTNVSARIENQTLRQALTAITRKLGLSYHLGAQAVILEPMPALARLGRRATVQELEALDQLSVTPFDAATDRPTLKQLLDAIDQKLIELKSPFSVEFRSGDQAKPDEPVSIGRSGSIADALEAIDRDTSATWYPWGKSIVVLPKEVQVRNLLRKTISIRFNGDDVSQVLAELSQQAGIRFEIEPGAVQRIAPEFRNIRLMLDNATVRQALESICGFTGLGYVVKADEVYIWNQSASPGGAGEAARDPVIATLQLDNGMQLFLRDRDLPADIREFTEKKKRTEFTRLRQMMKDENFVPTTQPTTKPTTNQDL